MKTIACCLLLAASSACAGAPPSTHYYQLVVPEAPLVPEAPPSEAEIVLAIEPLAVDAAYATERIVYRRSPYRLDYYNYHRWSATPALAVAEFLRQAYARTGLFSRVVLLPEAAAPTAILSGRILALEEVDESEARWWAHVALELTLLDPLTGRPLWSDSFVERERLEEQSPEGLAQAVSVALGRIVLRSSAPIARAAAALPRSGAARVEPGPLAR